MAEARVLIVGAGLVGSSLGIALSKAGYDVALSDVVGSHAVVAAGLGGGHVLEPDEEVDLVVVATPPAHIAATVADALKRYPAAVVTDVGSVKAPILAEVRRLAGDDASRYVGSHPMAGSQYTGPLTASGELFQERTWVITPADDPSDNPSDTADANADAVQTVVRMAEATGARVVQMPPSKHD